jgi:hypothetical protein
MRRRIPGRHRRAAESTGRRGASVSFLDERDGHAVARAVLLDDDALWSNFIGWDTDDG